jgi:hypothetical protein
MFNISLEAANFWIRISSTVMITGAVLVFIGALVSVRFAGIRDRLADSIAEQNARVTEEARASAANAAEKANALEAKAEELKLARLQLEAIVYPRPFTTDDAKALQAALADYHHPVLLVSYGIGEGRYYADQIYAALFKAGVIGQGAGFSHRISAEGSSSFTGVKVYIPVEDEQQVMADPLMAAMKSANILVTGWSSGMYPPIRLPETPVRLLPDERIIYVGDKPAPVPAN